MDSFLDRLNAERKGLWSLLVPRGSTFAAEALASTAPRDVEAQVLCLSRNAGILEFETPNGERIGPDIAEFAAHSLEEAKAMGRQALRIVIASFQDASKKEQCRLVKTARAFQEASTDTSCQFVFAGQWGYYTFRAAYREIHGHTKSPPAHSKDIIRVPEWSAGDILQFLAERRLTGAATTEIDRIAADFFAEQTGGDEFLIRHVVRCLETSRGAWTSNVEQALEELTEDTDVVNEITQRIDPLTDFACQELLKILKVQCVIRDVDNRNAEELWVAGLVRCRNLGSGKQCVHIAGTMVNTVVRRIIEGREPGVVAPPDDLCFERESLSSVAYRKIAQIEVLLRNVVVQQWYAEVGDKWEDKLKAIKTLSRQETTEDDLRQLVTTLVQSQLAESGMAAPDRHDQKAPPSETKKARSQASLLSSAQAWQARQRDHHGVELCKHNLMQFLTTEALMSVLVNKRDGLYGQGKPFSRKEYLVTAMEEYIVIRSAVAHNQALKLSTIARLDELHRKFVNWLTVYADQT